MLRVQGLGFKVQGLWAQVQVLGFRVQGLEALTRHAQSKDGKPLLANYLLNSACSILGTRDHQAGP